jgi:site-specific DNA recombinase
MTPAHTTRKGGLRYRYYTCVQAQKNGWQSCPSQSIPAGSIEQPVVEQIQRLGRDPLVLEQLLTTVRQQDDTRVAEWEKERVGLERDLLRGQSEVRKLLAEVGSGTSSNAAVTRLAELQARLAQVEQRLARLRGQREAWQQERLDQAAATEALAGLLPAWQTMTPHQQARVVRLLVARVDYDGKQGKASITFQPLGLKTLAAEMLGRKGEEQRA